MVVIADLATLFHGLLATAVLDEDKAVVTSLSRNFGIDVL